MQSAPDLPAKVRSVRTSISRALEVSARAPLAQVLADPGCTAAWIVKVLDVHPCCGKVAGRRLLASLGIAERTTLGGLSAADVSELTGSCRCNVA